jgi:sialate O-acetylesterase
VLWYQGENNAGNAFDGNQYIEKQRAMITDWRTWFGTPQMPFYSVQLAGWQAQSKDPSGGDGWSEFRDAQRRALAIPFTGMASAVDVGDVDDIHPKNKLDVGERMALWALRDVYGRKDTVVSGPLLKGVQSGKPGTLLVAFDHVDGGLTAGKMAGRGKFEPLPATAIGGFAIAGDDKVWHRATAAVDGDGIVLSAPGVTNPKFVRYGYRMNPLDANLYNKAGLPASPFRTDPQ